MKKTIKIIRVVGDTCCGNGIDWNTQEGEWFICDLGLQEFFEILPDDKELWAVLSTRNSKDAYKVTIDYWDIGAECLIVTESNGNVRRISVYAELFYAVSNFIDKTGKEFIYVSVEGA